MSKLKTKSGVKKRFKLTKSGKLRGAHAGKNHFMRHKTKDQSRDLRGTMIIEGKQADNVKKIFLPYGLS